MLSQGGVPKVSGHTISDEKNENVQIPKEKPKNPWEKPKNPGFSLQKPKNPGGFLGFWVFEWKTRVFANPGDYHVEYQKLIWIDIPTISS